MSATQSRLGAAARKARSTRSSQTRTPGTRIVVRPRLRRDQAGDAGLAHEPLDALAADPDAVGHAQLGVDARRSVDAPVRAVDLADALGQPRVLARAGRRRPALPGVKARAADAEHAAHRLDRVLGLLRRDEPEDHRRVSLSLAKKAAAFLRISRSSVSDPVLATQPAQLLALVAASGPRPCPRRRRAGAPSCAATAASTRARARAAGPSGRCVLQQPDRLTAELQRIRRGRWHRQTSSPPGQTAQPSDVHETGGTPLLGTYRLSVFPSRCLQNS